MAASQPDDLALLLATEQRLERVLAEVRGEASRLRETATEEVARADGEAEATLADARRRLTAELADEKATRIRAIELDAREAIDRWNGLRDLALEHEARRLAKRLVELAAEEP